MTMFENITVWKNTCGKIKNLNIPVEIITILIIIIPICFGVLIYKNTSVEDRLSFSLSAIAVAYGFIGFIGGIPTIKSWFIPKPDLKIEKIKLEPDRENNLAYHELSITVKNNGKVMATGVIVNYAIIQNDANKTIDDSSIRPTSQAVPKLI